MSISDFASVLLVALGLSADCFAVSIGLSCVQGAYTRSGIFRVAAAFGFFQAFMPALGWLAGRSVLDLIAAYDHWIAFGLLAVVGGRMIWESLHEKEESKQTRDMTRGLLLLTLAVATSIDALAVGLTFAFLRLNVGLASLTIGLVTFFATIMGFLTGRRLGEAAGKRAEIIGGIVLIGIGLRILLSHLL